MRETGLILKWYQNHLPRERKCEKSFVSICHVEANLDRTKGPFTVLIVGLTASFIVLILELLVAKFRENKGLFHRYRIYRPHSEKATSCLSSSKI